MYVIKTGGVAISVGTWSSLAYYFGTGREIEAYFAAAAAYYLSSKILQTGAAGSVVVPLYLSVKGQQGTEAGWTLLSNIINLTVVVALALTAIIIIAAPVITPLIVPGFEESSRSVVVELLRIMAIAFVSLPLTAFAQAILNSNEQFAKPAIFEFVGSTLYLGMIIFGVPHLGIKAVAVGLVLSSYVSLLLLLGALYANGYRHRWIIDLKNRHLRIWWGQLRPYFGYLLIMQGQGFLLTAILSLLPPGSMAIYRYGSDLMAKIIGYASAPVSTIALPLMSSDAIASDYEQLNRTLARALRSAIFITVPIFLVLIVSSSEIVTILLGRGQFTLEDASPVSAVVAILAVNVVLATIYTILNRVFVAIQRTGWANVMALLGQIYIIVLMLLLVPRWGYVGAAWHSVGATLALSITTLIVMRRLHIFPHMPTLLNGIPSIAISAVIALLAGVLVSQLFRAGLESPAWMTLTVETFAVIATYCTSVWILKVEDFERLLQEILSIISRQSRAESAKSSSRGNK